MGSNAILTGKTVVFTDSGVLDRPRVALNKKWESDT